LTFSCTNGKVVVSKYLVDYSSGNENCYGTSNTLGDDCDPNGKAIEEEQICYIYQSFMAAVKSNDKNVPIVDSSTYSATGVTYNAVTGVKITYTSCEYSPNCTPLKSCTSSCCNNPLLCDITQNICSKYIKINR